MRTTTEVQSVPPGPDAPAADQLGWFERDPFACVEEASRRYGTPFTLRLGSLGNEGLVDVEHRGEWVFLTRPEQLQAMYTAPASMTSGAHANQVFFGTMEESVGYIDGRAHRRRRSQLHPAFSGNRDYVAIIAQAVDSHLAAWPRDTPFELFPALQELTSEVITEVVCGNFDAADRRTLARLLPRTENARFTGDEMLAADDAVREFVAERMPGHLARSEALGRDDVLTSLLRHAAEGDGSLTDEVVRDEVFSLLYTGFSTTANTLAWAFVEVMHSERVQRALRAEVGGRFRHRPLAREEFGDLDYVDATVMEALRLHPVSALNGVRMVSEPLRIDDYLLPSGTILVHCAHVLQRSPDLYADPLGFSPERFLGKQPDQYVWGPFGGGTRTCVGRGYALAEMRMILAMAVSEIRLDPLGPVPRARQQGIFMGPADQARCLVRSLR
ncbi:MULTISPECIES: cytochrome P450 [Streptomyces]|uniref:cytochrome P450 n=1 Tax=Streptomyces TaxID=1883 RepID=UPI000CD50B4E|nr:MULTISPECIES: cytochrome P450 [Streptomyces]